MLTYELIGYSKNYLYTLRQPYRDESVDIIFNSTSVIFKLRLIAKTNNNGIINMPLVNSKSTCKIKFSQRIMVFLKETEQQLMP